MIKTHEVVHECKNNLINGVLQLLSQVSVVKVCFKIQIVILFYFKDYHSRLISSYKWLLFQTDMISLKEFKDKIEISF